MDSSHKVEVVRITDILSHPNADRLEIIPIKGFQVVSGKGQFKVGELAVYIQPDSVVPARPEFSFVWEKDGGGNLRVIAPEMEIPEKWRRITVRRLRKEYSEGLLMPVAAWPDHFISDGEITASEGEDVAEELGITHYNPPEPDELQSSPSVKQSKVWPRSLKGWMYFLSYWLSFGLYDPWGQLGGGNETAPENTPPVYDVETMKHFMDAFQEGESVVVTEKIHGCNARYTYRDSLFGGKMYAGSRKLWKGPKTNNIWRQVLKEFPDIERFCKGHPGFTLYGEAVPCQKSNRGGFEYTYGATKEHPKFYLFDVRNADGEWVSYPEAKKLVDQYIIAWVPPVMNDGVFGKDILGMAEGLTMTHDSHIREGIVIRSVPDRYVRNLGRLQLKVISNQYYELEKD